MRDDLPDLIGGEKLAWHGRAFDAISDGSVQFGIAVAVEKDARGEIGPFAAFSRQTVAVGAMRAEDARAGGGIGGSRMWILRRLRLSETERGKQEPGNNLSHEPAQYIHSTGAITAP